MHQVCEPQDRLSLEFEGRMDTARCAAVEAQIRTAVSRATAPVVFDLDRVDFVSSSFLRLCVFACRQAGADRFQIVNVGPAIKRVFKIAGLDGMLKGD